MIDNLLLDNIGNYFDINVVVSHCGTAVYDHHHFDLQGVNFAAQKNKFAILENIYRKNSIIAMELYNKCVCDVDVV